MADKYKVLFGKIQELCQDIIDDYHCHILTHCYFEHLDFIPNIELNLKQINIKWIQRTHKVLKGKHEYLLGDNYQPLSEGYFGLEDIYERSNGNMNFIARLTQNFTYGSPGAFVRLLNKLSRKRLNMALHAAVKNTPFFQIIVPMAKKFVRPTHQRDYKFLYRFIRFDSPEHIMLLTIILLSIPTPQNTRKRLCKSFILYHDGEQYSKDKLDIILNMFKVEKEYIMSCFQKLKDRREEIRLIEERSKLVFAKMDLD